MPRLMSVALTEDAVRERRKTVTRRLGWQFLKPGDRLTLVRKAMGRKRRDGTVEPLVRLAEVEVVDVNREPLCAVAGPSDLGATEVEREGFPGKDGAWFVEFFREHMRCGPMTEVTRIEWRYLDDEVTADD